MSLGYTTKAKILNVVPNLTEVSTLQDEDIEQFIVDAESEINARLAKIYTVAQLLTAPYIGTLATRIAIYHILVRVLLPTQLKDSVWPDRYKEAVEDLKEIAAGLIELLDTNNAVIASGATQTELWSNNMNYLPTFHEGAIGTHYADNIVDEDKIDDKLSERDL